MPCHHKEEIKSVFRHVARRPEVLLCRCFRFGMEMQKLLNPDWVSSLCRAADEPLGTQASQYLLSLDRAVRIPTGWRMKVHRQLFTRTLKALKFFSGKKKLNILEIGEGLGLLHGVTKVAEHQVRTIIEDEQQEPMLFKNDPEMFAQFSELVPDSPTNTFLDISTEVRGHLNMHDEECFADRFQKGARAVFKNENRFAHQRPVTMLYFILLIFDKEVNRMPSVESIYDFLVYGMGDDFDYGLDSFRVMCSRIGLTGNKWGKSMI